MPKICKLCPNINEFCSLQNFIYLESRVRGAPLLAPPMAQAPPTVVLAPRMAVLAPPASTRLASSLNFIPIMELCLKYANYVQI
jgi:hypothetical protein